MWCKCFHCHSSKRSSGQSTCHHQVNDLIWRALRRADIPTMKELTGYLRGDGKRPDGFTLVPWQGMQCLTRDATMMDIFASSYISSTSSMPGVAAEAAAMRKLSKNSSINQIQFHSGCFEDHGTNAS